jgi:hypothetical protein
MEGQTIQWPKEKGQNDKQRSTKQYAHVEPLPLVPLTCIIFNPSMLSNWNFNINFCLRGQPY